MNLRLFVISRSIKQEWLPAEILSSFTSPLSLLLLVPDVPSAPSAIALLLCTGSEMVLSWRAPAHNGGSPVCGYYLDQREAGTEVWREVNVKPAKERRFKVSAVTAAEFRALAAWLTRQRWFVLHLAAWHAKWNLSCIFWIYHTCPSGK